MPNASGSGGAAHSDAPSVLDQLREHFDDMRRVVDNEDFDGNHDGGSEYPV